MKVPVVRFNLKFYDSQGNEEVIRSLGGLREKFNLSDLYDYYKNGVLETWLRSIGENDLANGILSIADNLPMGESVRLLVKTLGLEIEESTLLSFVKVQDCQEVMRMRKLTSPKEDNQRCSNKQSYMSMLCDLVDHEGDYIYVRNTIAKILDLYDEKFRQDHAAIVRLCPTALFAVVSNWVWGGVLGYSGDYFVAISKHLFEGAGCCCPDANGWRRLIDYVSNLQFFEWVASRPSFVAGRCSFAGCTNYERNNILNDEKYKKYEGKWLVLKPEFR